MSLETPDWDSVREHPDWGYFPWQAVSLALDIDHYALRAARAGEAALPSDSPIRAILNLHQERLNEVMPHLVGVITRGRVWDAKTPEGGRTEDMVGLVDFAGVALRLGWKLPLEFPRWRPVDWNVWRDIPKAMLWQVVAVSTNVSPDFLRDDERFSRVTVEKFDLPGDFWKRYQIAEASLDDGLPTAASTPNLEGSELARTVVRLADFARLAAIRGWDLPEDFPRPTSTTDLPSTSMGGSSKTNEVNGGSGNVTVVLPYTTKKLDLLFQIMREEWATYDPRNPPKSKYVAQKIDERLGYKTSSDGKASRAGDALAAVIRPDLPVDGNEEE